MLNLTTYFLKSLLNLTTDLLKPLQYLLRVWNKPSQNVLRFFFLTVANLANVRVKIRFTGSGLEVLTHRKLAGASKSRLQGDWKIGKCLELLTLKIYATIHQEIETKSSPKFGTKKSVQNREIRWISACFFTRFFTKTETRC